MPDVGAGLPAAETVKLAAAPAVIVVDAALVITIAPLCTVSVNACVTLAVPSEAMTVIGNTPMLARLGVPVIVAVPFWLSVKLTPAGRAPVSLSDGAG